MAEDHELTVYIEIPIKVCFSTHPAEKATDIYPGCLAHLNIDHVEYDEEYMEKMLGGEDLKVNEYIHQKCVDALAGDIIKWCENNRG